MQYVYLSVTYRRGCYYLNIFFHVPFHTASSLSLCYCSCAVSWISTTTPLYSLIFLPLELTFWIIHLNPLSLSLALFQSADFNLEWKRETHSKRAEKVRVKAWCCCPCSYRDDDWNGFFVCVCVLQQNPCVCVRACSSEFNEVEQLFPTVNTFLMLLIIIHVNV